METHVGRTGGLTGDQNALDGTVAAEAASGLRCLQPLELVGNYPKVVPV